jgi:hypothetical protein
MGTEGGLRYPGSRPPIEHGKTKPPTPTAWDFRPQLWTVNGVETELFTIGSLAAATGLSPISLRRWESEGILPPPSVRTPKPTGTQAQGSKVGRRLYTRHQIELVVRGIELFKIRDGRKGKADWRGFTKYLLLGWALV